jgi:hypoxanthine phosphoribosyltransferase
MASQPTTRELIEEVLITPSQLQQRIAALARQIAAAYGDCARVRAVVLLMGAKPFAEALLGQLARCSNTRFEVHYLQARSYEGQNSTGQVALKSPEPAPGPTGPVLLIDDIYDTGVTLSAVMAHLRDGGANSLKTCVLLEKRRTHEQPVPIDFLGFEVTDEFVVGFGLDYHDRYRELPCIARLRCASPQPDK